MKLLTIDDLYSFFSMTGSDCNLNLEDDNLIVQMPAQLNYDVKESVIEGLTPVTLLACHTGKNANNSFISKETMEKALPSFSNKPILGYIHEIDGVKEFGGHEIHIDDNDDVIYDEKCIGIIPETNNASLVYDEDKEKEYVLIDGFIFDEYGKDAIEILVRESKLPVSIEINVKKLSYDGKTKILNIDDFYFNGVTILGKNDEGAEIKPGMEGANITLADFSKNSLIRYDINDKLFAELNDIKKMISAFNINNSFEEGGGESDMLDSLLKKYKCNAISDLPFEVTGLSDDELVQQFEKYFEAKDIDKTEEAETHSEDFTDASDKVDDDINEDIDEKYSEDQDSEHETDNELSEDEDTVDNIVVEEANHDDTHIIKHSINNREFEISLNDIQYALTELVNNTYSDTDNTWYSVIVYSTYLVMVDWRGAAYRQTYKVRKDVYSLVGDRVAVHAVYVTDDEEKALDELKTTYAQISSDLESYKSKEQTAEKISILESDDYAAINELSEFSALRESIDTYSVEELRNKCDAILLEYVKANKFEKNNVKCSFGGVVQLPTKKIKKGRYGNLFNKN